MKKAQINQMFIYLVSIIIIVSAGFLVTKFIFTFSSDTQLAADAKFYQEIEKDIQRVYVQYDSERSHSYSLSNSVEYVCFLTPDCSNKDSLGVDSNSINTILQTQDNLALFDQTGLLSSGNIGIFNLENNQCICIQPNNRRIDLFFKNIRNDVFIQNLN